MTFQCEVFSETLKSVNNFTCELVEYLSKTQRQTNKKNQTMFWVTSSFFTNSLAVGADIIMWRALGLTNPSSTAVSMNDSKEL